MASSTNKLQLRSTECVFLEYALHYKVLVILTLGHVVFLLVVIFSFMELTRTATNSDLLDVSVCSSQDPSVISSPRVLVLPSSSSMSPSSPGVVVSSSSSGPMPN